MTEAVIRAMRKQKSDSMLCIFILASDIYLFSCKTYLIHNYVINVSLIIYIVPISTVNTSIKKF